MATHRNRIHGSRDGFRPSSEQELLLRAALLSGGVAVEAWREWRRLVDPDLHHLGMESFRLIPLLFSNLSLLGVQDPILNRFKGVFRRTWYQSQLMLAGCAELLEAFQTAGLEVLLLDGVPLVLSYYHGLGLRHVDVIDVLVRSRQAEKAVRILTYLDYKPTIFSLEKLTPRCFEVRHALSFHKGPSLSCALNWELMPRRSATLDNDDFWEIASPLDLKGIKVRSLNITDQLLRICVRGVDWSWSPQIRWIADAMTILSGEHVQIDWKRLVSLAQSHRVSLGAYSSLSYLRNHMNVPIPADVLQSLKDTPTSDLEDRMFAATLRTNRFIGAMEHSWLRYRNYASERGHKSRLLGATGFLDYLRLRHGHDSLWRALRWTVSRGFHGMRTDPFRGLFQQDEVRAVSQKDRYPRAGESS